MSPTRKKVQDLRKRGMSVREIALILHISTQAVYRHTRALEGPAPRQKASA